MARQKKDGEKISLYVDKEILERLHTAMDKRLDQFGLDKYHTALKIL